MGLKRIKVTYEIVTPMKMWGAKRGFAELRLPSIKGALRSWYRVFMPAFNQPVGDSKVTHEEALFGGARSGAGQSRFLMRMTGKKPDAKNKPDFTPGQTFSFEVILRTAKDEDETRYWKVIASCLWLLGHAGRLGARKNRGYGVLALREWETNSQALEYMNDLPIAYQTTTIEEWRAQFGQGMKVITQWFPGSKLLNWATVYYYDASRLSDWKSALAKGEEHISKYCKKMGYTRLTSPIMLSVVLLQDRYVPIFYLRSVDFPMVKEKEKNELDHYIQYFRCMQEFKEAKWIE